MQIAKRIYNTKLTFMSCSYKFELGLNKLVFEHGVDLLSTWEVWRALKKNLCLKHKWENFATALYSLVVSFNLEVYFLG